MLKGSSSNGRQTRNSMATAEQFSTEIEETEPAEVRKAASRGSERRTKVASPTLLDLPGPDEKVLIYPFEGTGSVSITNADLARLQEGEFLNDTLIEFGLKLMFDRLKVSIPNIQDEVYIFNSFFYKKLTQKPTAGTSSYQSVKKWTSKVDLFSKKFIVVPINEFLHWYVAIVCFPDRILAPPPPKPEPKKKVTRSSAVSAQNRTPEPEEEDEPVVASPFFSPKKARPRNEPSEVKLASGDKQGAGVEDEVVAVESTAADDGKKAAVQSEDVQMDDSSSGPSNVGAIVVEMKAEMEAEGGVEEEGCPREQEDIEMEDSEPHLPTTSVETSGGQGTPAAEEVMSISPEGLVAEALKGSQGTGAEERKLPYIFIWDSLGSKHQKAVRVLKKYFEEEAKERKQMGENSAEAMICQYPRAPQQPNHCDCGLYLLHNVESFLQASTALFHHITAKTDREDLPEYRGDEVSTKRMSMRGEIGRLGEEWKQHLKSKQEAEERDKAKGKNDGKDVDKGHHEKEGKDEENEQEKKDVEEKGSAKDKEMVTEDDDAVMVKRRHDGSFGAQGGAPLEGGQDGSDQMADGGGMADARKGGGLGAMIEIGRVAEEMRISGEKQGEVFSTELGEEGFLGARQGAWTLDPTAERALEEHQDSLEGMDDDDIVQQPASNGAGEVGIGARAAKRASKSAETTEPVLGPSTSESPKRTQTREASPAVDSPPVKSSRRNRKRAAMEMQFLSDTSEKGSEEPIPIPTSSPIEDADTQVDRVRREDGELEEHFGQTYPHSHQSTPKKRKRAKRGLESGGTANGREDIVIDLSGSPT